jgi:hypothetical protein
MKINSKRILRIVYCIVAFFILSGTGFYIFRNQILHYFVDRKIQHLESAYDLSIHYKQLQFNGLREIDLADFSIVPNQRDTLMKLNSMQVKLNFLPLLIGDIELNDMSLDHLALTFIKKDSLSNYDFLFKKKEQHEPVKKRGYDDRVNSILNILYNYLPENGTLKDVLISKQKDNNKLTLQLPLFTVKDNHFDNNILIAEDNEVPQRLHAAGVLNHFTKELQLNLSSAVPHGKVYLPYLYKRYHAHVAFSSLVYSMTKSSHFSHITLDGELMVDGLEVSHKALSPEVIHLNRGRLDYSLNIGSNYVELDSTNTFAQFNRLIFNPYIKAEKNKKWHFRVAVDKSWFNSNDLFASLPQGLFGNLKGLRSTGQFAYHFLLDLDLANLNAMRLESDLKQRFFRIVNYGSTDLTRMNREFMYTAYDNGRPVRTFPIGPSWPHYTPIDSIPLMMQWAVLESEDGTFFKHHGFRLDMLRSALIYDLQQKRFARGGSTVSMQIIKNVFLNRNKNIARKLEEALIVWLIENEHITSKKRLLEVYFNIAEWAPNVYGIKEAAEFYFNKQPQQLTLEECICLASLIPKPKHFTSSFGVNNETGEIVIRGYMANYYRLIARLMAVRGIITRAQADSIYPYVRLTGRARNSFVIHRDTTAIDSTMMILNDSIMPQAVPISQILK